MPLPFRFRVVVVGGGAVAAFAVLAACQKPREQGAPTGDTVSASPTPTATPTATSTPTSTPAPTPSALPAGPVAFSAAAPPALSAPSHIEGGCAIDLVDEKVATEVVTVKGGATVKIAGWAADPATGAVPPFVFVELAGKRTFYAAAARGPKRPDVAKALGLPELVDAGFDLVADLSGVPAGTYAVQIDQVSTAGAAFTCNARRKIKVL